MWKREIKKADWNNLKGAHTELKFLWKSDKAPIYIMDNHLAAAWCWMQECNIDEKYNFMHIDQHSDLGVHGFAKDIVFIRTNPKISLEDYCEITYSISGHSHKSIQCDNYISVCHHLFPNWFNTNLFYYTDRGLTGSIQGSGYENFSEQRMDKGAITQHIKQFIEEQVFPSNKLVIDEKMQKKKWIVNLDLDFFWDENENRIFNDQFINDLGISIGNAMNNIQVLTIALSPLWCGGKNNALECSKLFLSNSILVEFCKEFLEEKELL